jgi:hypothetical protein
MKFQRLFSYFFALLLVASLTGCDKDDKDKEPSKRDLLTAGKWTGSAIFVNGNDLTREFREDEDFPYDISQNTITFDKAGTYVDSYIGVSENGTWEFTNNEQALLLDKGTTNQTTLSIGMLTNSELYLTDTFNHPDLGELALEVRYVR